MQVFNGGLRLRVSLADGRLQRKLSSQILFTGVFSTKTMRFFLFSPHATGVQFFFVAFFMPLSRYFNNYNNISVDILYFRF
jgi:hypothetical protein